MIQRKPRALQEADQAFKLASTAEELGDVSRGGLHPLSLSFLTGKVGAGLPRLEVVVILWWDEGAWELEAVTAPSDCRTLTASPCCCQETADQRGSMTSPKSHSQLILKPEREVRAFLKSDIPECVHGCPESRTGCYCLVSQSAIPEPAAKASLGRVERMNAGTGGCCRERTQVAGVVSGLELAEWRQW